MPLDRTLLPCSLHPLHTRSALRSPSPPTSEPSEMKPRCSDGLRELLCVRAVLACCACSSLCFCHACLPLQLSDCCIFFSGLVGLFTACLAEGSLLLTVASAASRLDSPLQQHIDTLASIRLSVWRRKISARCRQALGSVVYPYGS